jgi:hypothetical protein
MADCYIFTVASIVFFVGDDMKKFVWVLAVWALIGVGISLAMVATLTAPPVAFAKSGGGPDDK